MRFASLLFVCVLGAFAQAPPLERFTSWRLVNIEGKPAVSRYEYTVWNEVDDAFMGFSTEPLKLRLNTKVKAYIQEPRFIYIVDDEGVARQLNYVWQAEMVPARK